MATWDISLWRFPKYSGAVISRGSRLQSCMTRLLLPTQVRSCLRRGNCAGYLLSPSGKDPFRTRTGVQPVKPWHYPDTPPNMKKGMDGQRTGRKSSGIMFVVQPISIWVWYTRGKKRAHLSYSSTHNQKPLSIWFNIASDISNAKQSLRSSTSCMKCL